MSISSTGADATGPTIRSNGVSDVYASWFVSPVDVYFSHSSDQGRTFANRVLVSQGKSMNTYFGLLQRSPRFVVTPNGIIHLVWLEDRGAGPDVNYTTSSDKGQTWSMARSILPADTKTTQDFTAIAADSSGRIFISYLETGDYMQYRVIRSDDGGTTWSPPSTASQLAGAPTNAGTCECCLQTMEVSPEGHIYAAWRSNIGGDQRDIFVSRSTDLGASWNVIKAQLGQWTISGCPTTGPKLTLDNNEMLHITWSDSRDDSGKRVAYYANLPKGADAIVTNTAISGSVGTPNWPAIARNRTGDMQIVFEGSGSLYSVISTNNGQSWTAPQHILMGGSKQNNVDIAALTNGKFLLAVQDSRNGKSQIFVANDTTNRTPSGVLTQAISLSAALYPNPASREITTPIGGSYSIFDALGRSVGAGEISAGETITVEHLSPGAYTVVISGVTMRFIRQ